ncbi:hypothetical protein FHS16_005558 [Paenibacillus endophyticus]|uniref:pPIWI-RE three-gene island domain-containing protein n=1 Tax=Paenibacillus endophyticus TaxID=1294268 RepID=A0A7W5CD24_9BACL|nr:hypothetical protein [Paenibacillus endophyticus]MBB3155450.1 hypothetical protein [Paenibacillus endophyticus]
MRNSYFDYLSEFCGRFQGTMLSKPQLEAILVFEWMIVGCRLGVPGIPVKEAWSVLIGYDEPILPKQTDIDIVHRLRVLFREIRSERKWTNITELYNTIDTKYLLFEWRNAELTKRTPLQFSERERWYEEKLRNPIVHKQRTLQFAKQGEFSYKRWLTGDIPHKFTGHILNQPDPPEMLPVYRDKRRSKFEVNEVVDKEAYKEVSAGSTQVAISERHYNFQIRSLSVPPETTFHYDGVQHLVGGLGTGKTSLMLSETIRLVKDEGARVGFIESSVAQVLKRVEELRLIGIDATPIIGRSNRELYERQYLSSKRNNVEDLAEWGDSLGSGLSHVSSLCLIHAIADDYDAGNHFPCKKLTQGNNNNLSCPFAGQCGLYKDYMALSSSTVWVTTTSCVLKTKLPAFIDPLERSIYEAMYDLLDVIFVDEADEVQKQFDSAFVNEFPLFGDTKLLFERLYKESMNVTLGRYAEYAGDYDIDYWNQCLVTMERVSRAGIYEKLVRSPRLSEFVRRRMIRMTTITYQVAHACSIDNDQQVHVHRNLKRYMDDPLAADYVKIIEELLNAQSQHAKRTILDHFLVFIGGGFRTSIDRELWYDVLEFYLYLVRADYCMREIKEYFPIIKAKLNLVTELHPQFAVQEDLQSFMKDAMTGSMTGYSYDIKQGQDVGTFKLIEYTGVGRLLLQEWSHLYEHSDNMKGPAVVLLSGTSYAPGSPHYNLELAPTWMLERYHDEPQITQHYWPIYDEDPDNALYVSGLINRDHRNRAIQTMTRKLLRKIEQELLEWKRSGVSRKALIIVNSYEDVELVGHALSAEAKWKGRYRLLQRELALEDETAYSRSNLESFHYENADLLVAPLMSINRGYNILDENRGSVFGSVFFLIRPYPVPNDISYLIQMIHAKHNEYIEEIRAENKLFADALKLIRKKSNHYFHYLYERPDYWAQLSELDRKSIAWYTFVPIWQTIGRMIRNGSPAHVFYCDAKFDKPPKYENKDSTMLGYWRKIMLENKHRPEFFSLYSPFIESIQTIRGIDHA